MAGSFDYIDEETKLIINGYIRNVQKLLTLPIPTGITYITLSYIDDHFMMYRGSYEWKIKDKQFVQNILAVQQDQYFVSDVFEIGKLKWVMKIYPNGNSVANTPIGSFDFFVEILSFPCSWHHILVCLTLQFKELNTMFTGMFKYKTYGIWAWNMGTLSLTQVRDLNPSTLTFCVNLKILRIVSKTAEFPQNQTFQVIKYQSKINNYQKRHNFRWTLHKNNQNTRIFSPIFGEMFCVYYEASTCTIAVRLCGLPNEQQIGICVDGIQIKWRLNIIEANISFSTVGKLGYDDYSILMDSKLLLPAFDMDDYKDQKEFTFVIDVEILSEYDLYGNVIGINVEDEWEQFIKKEIGDVYPNAHIQRDQLHVGLENTWDELKKNISRIERVFTKAKRVEMEKFRSWLVDDVKLEEYLDILVDNGFDCLDAVSTANVDQLKAIGIDKIGHRQQLMKSIRKLNYIHIRISPNTLYLLSLVLLVMFVIVRRFV